MLVPWTGTDPEAVVGVLAFLALSDVLMGLHFASAGTRLFAISLPRHCVNVRIREFIDCASFFIRMAVVLSTRELLI